MIDFQIVCVIFGSIFFFFDFLEIFFNITEILFLSTISFLNFLFFTILSTNIDHFLIISNNLLSSLSNFFLIISIFLFIIATILKLNMY